MIGIFRNQVELEKQRIAKRSTSHLLTAASHKNLKTSGQILYLLRCSELLLKVLILLPILDEGTFLVRVDNKMLSS
jgi:hypothetical protein